MPDAMVTARMSQSKKNAGNEILRELGYSASQAINELYDRVLETHAWPLAPSKKASINLRDLNDALAFVDGIARVSPDDFIDMSDDEAKQRRLIGKGRASKEDFE